MKKIFFALAALVLAFTGCSQEEEAIQVSEKKAVKVVVNMDKPGFGTDARAARTKWEDGDQVIGTMGAPNNGILLTYVAASDSWTTKMLSLSDSGTNYVEADFDVVMESFLENPEDAEGIIHAAYFSSRIFRLTFEAPNPPTITMPTMVIRTYASLESLGECVMTCENGTYKVEETAGEYVLTLNITMKPQVAQFTIKDLDIADDWNVYAHGPFNCYAGGLITSAGVELTPLSWGGNVYCHDNEDGISFYVAPWQSETDMPDDYEGEYSADYLFNVYDDYTVDTEREFPFTQVAIGDAVIFDGPDTKKDGELTAGAQKWN